MKKQNQLGMNPSTASGRLVKDLLFHYVKDVPCFRCGEPLTRDTFSIEHKVPWLDSDNPVELFFDLQNISFSHLRCNVKVARKERSSPERKQALKKAKNARYYTPEKRKERYERTGR